ncbi:MAG TPA: hypothetical protein P5277_02070 [Candidatus Paceibacterota bacterium]|nr:hypothetical protein [Candidatus Paceibacterota bacterium]
MKLIYHGNIGENENKTFHIGIVTNNNHEEIANIFTDYSETGLKFDNLGKHYVNGQTINIYRLKPWENGTVMMTQLVYVDINSLKEIAKTYHFNFVGFRDGSVKNEVDLAEKLKKIIIEKNNLKSCF